MFRNETKNYRKIEKKNQLLKIGNRIDLECFQMNLDYCILLKYMWVIKTDCSLVDLLRILFFKAFYNPVN